MVWVCSANKCSFADMNSNRIYSIVFSALLIFGSCNSDYNQIGQPVDTQNAVGIKEALSQYSSNSTQTDFIVFGRVKEVCQAEGCWFAYDIDGENLVVDFNDEFTVPKGIAKKNAYSVGHFYKDTIWLENDNDTLGNKFGGLATKFLATGVRFK